MESMDSSEDEDDGVDVPPVRIPLGNRPVLFAMPGSLDLATRALALLGWPAGQCTFRVFANGEVSPKVEQCVANCDVFVLCARNDDTTEVNLGLMQLLFFVSALRGESPHRITIIWPCLDYSRQDRRLVAGEAIPPVLLLRCLRTAGANRFLTIDLHNQAESAFAPDDTVLDELSGHRYMADFIRENVPNFDPDHVLVCSTNGGGLTMTRHMADELRTGIAMADRVRDKRKRVGNSIPAIGDGSVGGKQLVHEESGDKGRVKIMCSSTDGIEAVVIVADLFDTCSTLVGVCQALCDAIPKARIYAVATHGYFSGDAHVRVKEMVDKCNLQWIGVTNSVLQDGPRRRFASVGIAEQHRVVDISKLLAGAAMRIHLGISVNSDKFRILGPADADPSLAAATQDDPMLSRSEISSPSLGAKHVPPFLPALSV